MQTTVPTNITRSVPHDWTLMQQTPIGTNNDAWAFADAERQLHTKFPSCKKLNVVFEIRGDGAQSVDLEGTHWVPNTQGAARELRAMIPHIRRRLHSVP